jgi:presenilin-like A22 family membrane protease
MKHNLKINVIIILLFIVSQVIGLAIINNYIEPAEEKVEYSELPLNIETAQESDTSFVVLIIGVLIATGIAFALLKFRIMGLWKLWFFAAVFMALTIALSTIFVETIAITLAIVLALFKLFRPNIFLHNITEVLIYGGIAAIFVPMLNIFSALMLLLLISVYDIIAVNHSKHMVKLAKMQAKAKTFAGLNIPYIKNKVLLKKGNKKTKAKSAILGGGDIVFPLLFTGAVFKSLILENPLLKTILLCFLITLFTALSLLYLLIKAEKKKFYPAMPYITAGCLIGYLFIWLINSF